jgi:hypothetical protein
VPGIAVLNTGGQQANAAVGVDAVSCAAPGNCAAGGQYATAGYSPTLQPFVVTETKGTWDTAQEVPGIGAVSPSLWAETTFMACPPAGNCTADGYYQDASFEYTGCHPQCWRTFVVNERQGCHCPADDER